MTKLRDASYSSLRLEWLKALPSASTREQVENISTQ